MVPAISNGYEFLTFNLESSVSVYSDSCTYPKFGSSTSVCGTRSPKSTILTHFWPSELQRMILLFDTSRKYQFSLIQSQAILPIAVKMSKESLSLISGVLQNITFLFYRLVIPFFKSYNFFKHFSFYIVFTDFINTGKL